MLEAGIAAATEGGDPVPTQARAMTGREPVCPQVQTLTECVRPPNHPHSPLYIVYGALGGREGKLLSTR